MIMFTSTTFDLIAETSLWSLVSDHLDHRQHSCHLQFDCRDCVVEFCTLDLLLLVHDVLLLLLLLNLDPLLVQPLDLAEGKDV